jgi:hypothetical protein
LRQVVAQRSIFSVLFGDSGLAYSLNPWTSAGFSSSDGVAVSSGHHIWTATTAMGIGLGIALWRCRRRGARVAAFALPIALVVLSIAEHASHNAYNADSRWPGAGGEGFSALLSGLWSATGHGRLSEPLSVVLLVTCLAPAMDGVRSRPGGAVADTEPGLGPITWWQGVFEAFNGPSSTRWGRAVQVAARVAAHGGSVVIRAVAQWSMDLGVVLAAHARVGDEPRREALMRGQAVSVRVRGIRAEAMTLTTPGAEPAARRTFARVGAVVGVLALGMCLAWGAYMAAAIGPSLSAAGDSTYLAGLLDSAGSWWHGLNPWQQLAVGAGIAAVTALSGGSLLLAFGNSGAATYGLAKPMGRPLSPVTPRQRPAATSAQPHPSKHSWTPGSSRSPSPPATSPVQQPAVAHVC